LRRRTIRPFGRYRIGANRHPSIAVGDDASPAVDVSVEQTLDGPDEILTVLWRLESNTRASEEALEQLSPARADRAAAPDGAGGTIAPDGLPIGGNDDRPGALERVQAGVHAFASDPAPAHAFSRTARMPLGPSG
jgi:hypothetical protein